MISVSIDLARKTESPVLPMAVGPDILIRYLFFSVIDDGCLSDDRFHLLSFFPFQKAVEFFSEIFHCKKHNRRIIQYDSRNKIQRRNHIQNHSGTNQQIDRFWRISASESADHHSDKSLQCRDKRHIRIFYSRSGGSRQTD